MPCLLCGKQEARPIYIGYFDMKDIYSCDEHYPELDKRYIRNKRFSNANLHLAVDSWENTKTHKRQKVTTGKAWEIAHRTLAEDGKTVVNSVTGKEAEY